jgi:hypothetical protein
MLFYFKIYDLSTGHVTEQTAKMLERHPSRWPVAGWQGQHGWIIYAHDERPEECPDDLWLCIEHARAAGGNYLRLDSDGDTVDGLPVYEW